MLPYALTFLLSPPHGRWIAGLCYDPARDALPVTFSFTKAPAEMSRLRTSAERLGWPVSAPASVPRP